MSDKKKVYVPSSFITSERYYQSKTTIDAGIADMEAYNIKKWFLDKDNEKYLTDQLYRIYIKHDYKYKESEKLDYRYFNKNVPNWMEKFVWKNKIEFYMEDPDKIGGDYSYVGSLSASDEGYKYYITALSKVNKEFCKEHYYLISQLNDQTDLDLPGTFGKPDWNPFRASTIVGTKNEFENTMTKKSYHDMVYDIDNTRNMDIWYGNEIIRQNSNFRYNNRIPVWQNLGRSRTGLDRSNDGLHDSNKNRASLENQIHGYNMSDVRKYATSLQYNRKDRW